MITKETKLVIPNTKLDARRRVNVLMKSNVIQKQAKKNDVNLVIETL